MKRQAESPACSSVIHHCFNSRNSSLRNMNVLLDTKYVLQDTRYVLLGHEICSMGRDKCPSGHRARRISGSVSSFNGTEEILQINCFCGSIAVYSAQSFVFDGP